MLNRNCKYKNFCKRTIFATLKNCILGFLGHKSSDIAHYKIIIIEACSTYFENEFIFA